MIWKAGRSCGRIGAALDRAYDGPADLTHAFAQGRLAPGFDGEEPVWIAALKAVPDARKTGAIRAKGAC